MQIIPLFHVIIICTTELKLEYGMKGLWAWEILRGGTLYIRPDGNNLDSHIQEGAIRQQGLPSLVPRYGDPQLCHAKLLLTHNLAIH